MNRLVWLVALLLIPVAAQAQTTAVTDSLVGLIALGRTAEARSGLAAVRSAGVTEPGLRYVAARLTTDGAEAARLYEAFLTANPTDPYADDALFSLYQYQVALGQYPAAERRLAEFRRRFPTSPLAPPLVAVAALPLPETPVTGDEPVQPAPVAATEPSAPGEAPGVGGFSVQVGAFGSKVNALALGRRLGKAQPISYGTKVKGNTTLNLVWVGQFPTREAAQRYADGLRRTVRDLPTPIIVAR